MPFAEVWFKAWIYLGLVCGWAGGARPRFDTSTDMGLVLVPADAEIDSVIFRLRATDQDADFPLVFEVTATITPVVRIDNLPCTLYNKVCQANVILTKRLIPGRLHDFAVRVRDNKGDSNSMQATISATNATTSRDKIFPHIPSLIMVPEDTKPGKELDYILVRANPWSGKPVYIELWQPKELFTVRQRQTPTQTRGVIMLIGELDFEMQSMYTLTIYATDPYTEPGQDTRNIAGLNIVVVVQDVQDMPPIFTLAPPLTRLNNSVQTGDVILRVHAEDGDKGVPRDIVYGLVSEGNPFVPFFNISETTGEIVLARPLEELTQITHVGAPVVLSVVAEEIRRSRDEPPAQATVVEVGFLLGEPGNSPPYFENDKYIASIPENLEPGAVITFPEQYSARVHDEDIGKAGVFALKLRNNNGTFEINPAVAERTANFIITVRDNTLIDYEMHKSLSFKIVAQEVGPATNLSVSADVVIFIQDVNDNSPMFDEKSYEVTLSENVTAGTRVIQVHATDEDTGLFGSIKYTDVTGQGGDAFAIEPDTGWITVAMGSSLDREMAGQLQLTVYARDENGRGNAGAVPLLVNLLDVNDNAPIFEKDVYEFTLNSDLTNFTTPVVIKATDADAEPPNNEVRYELIHGNYENKFYLNGITGELVLRSPITKYRRKKQSVYDNLAKTSRETSLRTEHTMRETATTVSSEPASSTAESVFTNEAESKRRVGETKRHRGKREENDILYTLTARAYDLGVPHLSSETKLVIARGSTMEARIMMFVVPGEHPDLAKTVETLATITGGRVTVLDTRPYVANNRTGVTGGAAVPAGKKRTTVVARVEQTEPGVPLVDVEKIRNTLAANGVGVIGGAGATNVSMTMYNATRPSVDGVIHDGADSAASYVNKTISDVHEEVTVYKAENKLLFWLLIILGLLMLLAIAALIICCICPGCPFYMAPRKRRVYSSETLVARSDGRPRRHVHRKPMTVVDITSNGKKQAWSADPTRRNWQFNRRNAKNGGLASLPGDVVYISERPPIDQATVESLRLRDGPPYDPSRRRRIEEQERMYVEDVEERKTRDYDAADADSLQRHEVEGGSDILRQAYRQRYEPEMNDEPTLREQHFYREGNAEVLQLVTRGQAEDNGSTHRRHYPTTLIVDGKDVLLQRFMQDQRARHEMQEPEMLRAVDQRPKTLYQHQQEVLLLPEDLEIRHRRADELESDGQKDDGVYEARRMDAESQMHDVRRQEVSMNVSGVSPSAERPREKDQTAQSATVQSYAFRDLELARQNVLLTRLLLERHAGGVMMDAASYLETQSLPGQVAIATQTDRVAATQTERLTRSRSDNDESDEDARKRRKMKTKKRHGGERESSRIRALWMKSPIEEEEQHGPCFDKRLNILRKKVREVRDGRKVSLEPEVLREISDSLGENGSNSCREREEEKPSRTRRRPAEESFAYKVLDEGRNGSSSPSTGMDKRTYERTSDERRAETWSSPEVSVDNGKYVRETTEEKSSRKESKVKKHKKVESIIRPSFRVLEREITMLTKKLSKLADKKKVQQAAVDESTSQEKSRAPKDSKKDSDQGASKRRTEESKERKRRETSPSTSKETTAAKTRQKLKRQQPQLASLGSSEYDDASERSKKSKSSGFRVQEVQAKQTQSGHASRARARKTQTQIERKEHKRRQAVFARQDREAEERKDAAASKEGGRPKEPKAEKPAGLSSRAQKLAAIGRRENVSEEPSTSTSSDRANGKGDAFAARESDKKSRSGSSGVSSSRPCADRRGPRRKADRASERFSDEFATEERRREDTDVRPDVCRTVTSTGAYERHVAEDRARDIEIVQRFSDDFVMETEPEDAERRAVPASEMRDNVHRDSEQEHATAKEVAEDIEVLRNLGYVQLKSESMSDTATEQPTESLEVSHVEQPDDVAGSRIIPLDSLALEASEERQTEKPYSSGDVEEIEEKIARMSEKSEDEMAQPSKEILGEERVTKDSEDVKDATGSPQPNGGDTIVESREAGEEPGEKLSRESKERTEEGTPLAESDKGVMEESVRRENEEDSLSKIKSDAEEKKLTIATVDTDSRRDVTGTPKDISKERVTRESDSESAKEEVKSTTKAFEETPDVTKSPVNLIDTRRASSAKSDETLTNVDEISQEELPKDVLIQTETAKVTDVTKEEADAEKTERSDELAKEVEVESHEAEEKSHVSPRESPDLEETTLNGADERGPFASLTEATTIAQEATDEESLQIEHAKMVEEEETLHEEKAKAGGDETIGESRGSTDGQLSRDSNLEESAVSEPEDTAVKSETVAADPQDRGEQRADVSVPLFTSFDTQIDDTVGVSEESDSSSDISRKTTLTARPYDTPRHRQKREISDDERDAKAAKIEPGEDTDGDLSSLDEIASVDDSTAIEAAAVGERKARTAPEIAAASERVSTDDEEVSSALRSEGTTNGETRRDGLDSDYKFEKSQLESETDAKTDVSLTTAVQAVVPLVLSVEERLSDASRKNVEDESVPVTKEERASESAEHYEKIEEVFETVKQQVDRSGAESSSKQVEQAGPRRGETRTEDARAVATRSKDAAVDKTRRSKDSKIGTLSIPGRHVARIIDSSEGNSAKRRKKPERSPGERKRAPDEESKEKMAPIRSRRQSQKQQTRDGESAHKQPPRREEERAQRAQALSRSRARPDKRSTISPKRGEIDTSKAQSKYMAWYNKKREEAEKKRSEEEERRATEDEEQLPRWVSRGLRYRAIPRPTRDRQQGVASGRMPEVTPRARRKIKPLVNVESEQLKAIVRQGRELRRAEGILREDPPIQIFARTPPVTADTRHRLVQHSEYKYERIPPPFYLHPPPVPHPSPQLSPERSSFEAHAPCASRCVQTEEERVPSTSEESVAAPTSYQRGGPPRLRHQQLLEKKSVFDIAYSEAAPSQLRSDSATPPS